MKKIILTACAIFLSILLMQAQKNNEAKKDSSLVEKLHVKLKDGAKPDIYVDGKKFDFSIDLLDEDKIESVFVIKGEKAITEYNSPNGVILITTKKNVDAEKSTEKTSEISITDEKSPLVIIDGKITNKGSLKNLSPDDIEKIEVFKDEKAIKKYNAPNGAIIITTKKKKKD
ncbi:hypothetical protein HNV10_11745 [Winogradskyella litoriviva]|uniref:TonB-dependent receptor plug domain-containing protein n=1 Tax=Winogradskyella litoriviva TaxID=1220182 RepID=A0ABX2E8A0_9FLAO|nr:hypothetical protein [Winogradskyella litoriviva]NRD23921.1 hypothetical protein [Winogradskyella litoriviva]